MSPLERPTVDSILSADGRFQVLHPTFDLAFLPISPGKSRGPTSSGS